MGYVRVSPGIYRDTATGKTVHSNTAPTGGAAAPGVKAPAANRAGLTVSKTPTGTQQVKIDPKTGLPQVTTTNTPGQQNVLTGMEGASTGAFGAIQNIQSQPGFGQDWQNSPQFGNYTDSVFNSLSGAGKSTGLDANLARDKQQLEQTMYNRGIPQGSQLWNDQIAQQQDQYSTNVQQAHDSAFSQGVGAFNQGQQTQNQTLGALQQIGAGGYAQQPGVDVNSLFNTLQGTHVSEDQIAAQRQIAAANNATQQSIARLKASQAGNGSTAALQPSPFSGGAPPGYAQ